MRILLVLFLLAGSVSADDWKITNVNWSGTTDSVRLTHWADADQQFTAKSGSRNSWDTTLDAVAGRVNYAVYSIWFSGATYPSNWVIQNDLKTGQTGSFLWYLHGARFPGSVDSSKLFTYRDTVAQDTVEATTSTTVWDAYPITAYVGSMNTADIKIWYTGETIPATWKWALNKTDTTGGLPEPSVANHCIVWGDVGGLGMSLSQAKNARVYFTLAGKVNDTCADRVYVRFTTDTLVDVNGRFQKELPWSSCLGGAEYNVKILLRNGSSVDHSFVVPDSSRYKLIW